MTREFSIDVDMENLQRLAGSLDGIPDRVIELTANEFERQVKREAPKARTGYLQTKWRAEKRGKGEWVVGSPLKYAQYVNDGTRPHTPPMQAIKEWAEFKHLPWFPVWLSIVRKGTKANPYINRAKEQTTRQIPLFVNQAIRGAKV